MTARRPSLAYLALALSSCGGATSGHPGRAYPVAEPGEGAIRHATLAGPQDAGPGAEEEMLHTLNRAAREGAVTETLGGLSVEDPYRTLETESDVTRRWVDAQTARTAAALARAADAHREARLAELLHVGTIGRVAVGGSQVFYAKRDGDREQAALFVRDTHEASATPHLLVDPIAYGDRAALDWFYPSPHGAYVAFGISSNGDEKSTLRVLEVATGQLLPEQIAHTKWCNLSWRSDERGFFYTRYPHAGEEGYDAQAEDTYFPRIFSHRLHDDVARDERIFGAPRNTDVPQPALSDDDRWLVINNFRGWSASDVHLVDLHQRAPAVVDVLTGRENLTSGVVVGGKLYLGTNIDAPKSRIVVADDLRRAADAARWRVVVPEGQGNIENWTFVGRDTLAVQTIEDVRARIQLFRVRDGHAQGDVDLPTRGELAGFAGDPASPVLAFAFDSYFYPPTLFAHVPHTRQTTPLDRVQSDLATDAYELEQEQVASADGTSINVYLVHKRGLVRDGTNPVLLTGYGGFNVSLYPTFTRHALYFLERGGVYAVANLRGGGEQGETWHQAGNLLNKKHVFEDFEAVIRWLSSSHVSRPDRIAITGGSNGGLLMGAMITRCPDAFGAVASYVGLYDMMRYHRFPPAEIWASEYGSANDPAQAAYLHSYSPYHNVHDGTPYPSILIETADHDSRVYWGHSTKFAARLQEASSSNHPIYFYMVHDVGHGAGTRLTDTVARYDRMYAFLESQLGMSGR